MNSKHYDNSGSAAICVLSYDGASDLWAPFFDGLMSAWPNLTLPVYLLTNHKQYDGPHNVRSLAVGEDRDWSSNLIKALDGIQERHILFIFDDFFIRKVDVLQADHFIKRCTQEGWGYLTLHPNNYIEKRLEQGIRQISEHGVYRCTLVYGIFRKDVLENLLKPGESAWDFEIESGIRARGLPLYSVEKRIFRHYHLLRKGKWMRPGFPALAAKYDLDRSRPVETNFDYLLREAKEWVFRKYHKLLPGKMIERRENRRKA
ncbi:MAG: hypothetical protein ACRBBK_11605 [Paracoccaceae bacterium]